MPAAEGELLSEGVTTDEDTVNDDLWGMHRTRIWE